MANFAVGIQFSFYIYSLFYLNGILVKQYYSINRVNKVILNHKRKLTLYLIFKVLFFTLQYTNTFIFYISEIIIDFVLILSFKITIFPLTRRNILLLLCCFIFTISLFSYFSIFNIEKLLISFSLIIIYLVLVIAYIFLYPFECFVQNYYIKKAKRKIADCQDLIVIGITGSYGKTTMKNYLVDFIDNKYKVCYSKSNINTLMGITRFINENLKSYHEILVVEIGIDQVNGMDKFRKILNLDYAIITRIGKMHLATFKTEENILKGKLKIKQLLKKDGILLVNKDDEKLKGESEIGFSKNGIKNYYINDKLELSFEKERVKYKTNVFSPFALLYIDALFIVGKYLNLTKRELRIGINNLKNVDRRFCVKKINEKIVIDDTYNNSLDGISESLKYLKENNIKPLIIFSKLIELGKCEESIYQNLKEIFMNNQVILVGDYLPYGIESIAKERAFDLKDALHKAITFEEKVIYVCSEGENTFLH